MWSIQILITLFSSLYLHELATPNKITLKEIFECSLDAMKSNDEVKIHKHPMNYYFTQDKGNKTFHTFNPHTCFTYINDDLGWW